MSDEELRRLERNAISDPSAEFKLQKIRARSGALSHIWKLQYSKDSVGMDGTIIGLFTTRQACVDHIKKHEKHFRPGRHNRLFTCYQKFDESFNEWTNGYRGLIIGKVPIHEGPAENWFAGHEKNNNSP